jgi:hypothetical protein
MTEATFKEELTDILLAHGNRWMTIRELADAVNLRGRYWKKDQSRICGKLHLFVGISLDAGSRRKPTGQCPYLKICLAEWRRLMWSGLQTVNGLP